MELWIRSQDRETLTKVEYIELYTNTHSYEENMYELECDMCTLGTYKSKERAIEIPDEIQKEVKYITDINIVYEMPKE